MSTWPDVPNRLLEAEVMYRRLVESQPDLICRFLPDSTLTFVNQAYARFFQKAPGELVGRKFLDFLGPEEQVEVRRNLASFTAASPERQYEHATPRADGEVRWHLWHDYAFFDEQGLLTGLQSVGVDITDRKRAEARMRCLIEVLLSLGDDIATDAGKLTELCGELLGASCAFYNRMSDGRLFSLGAWRPPEGYERLKVLEGQICHDLLKRRENLTSVLNQLSRGPYAQSNPDVLRFGFETYVGHPVFCRGEAVGVLSALFREAVELSVADGQFVSLLAFAMGVQEERERAREQERRLQTELANVQKMESISRLAGGVAHDFNNQLTVITGLAQMMQTRMPLSSSAAEDVAEILGAARHAAELTRRLLGFAQRQTVVPVVLDLNQAVKSLLPMLRRLTGEVELVWRPAEDLWSVQMDPAQLDQVLASLLTNAREATTESGRIEVQTANEVCTLEAGTCSGRLAPGDYVRLSVLDNGRGISADLRDKIFEPFFTTKPGGVGAGLGLSTVYGIVKQNRGCICVESEPGKGARFDLLFPRYHQPAAPAAAPHPTRMAKGRGERILLVEDEAAVLNLARRILEKAGYAVLTAGGPAEAMRLAEQHAGKIDLLLTDVVMPEMNGPTLAQRLLSQYPALKCMFMSGFSADAIGDRGLLQEGVPFVHKPFSMESLASAVREALDQK